MRTFILFVAVAVAAACSSEYVRAENPHESGTFEYYLFEWRECVYAVESDADVRACGEQTQDNYVSSHDSSDWFGFMMLHPTLAATTMGTVAEGETLRNAMIAAITEELDQYPAP